MPAGVVVLDADTAERRAAVDAVCERAFGATGGAGGGPVADPARGGAVLALRNGVPVAAARWTDVVGATSEIVSVAVVPAQRRRGLGSVLTVAAAAGAARGGADLVWLTPRGAASERVYRALGFTDADGVVPLDVTAG